jgi:hypothetical protein
MGVVTSVVLVWRDRIALSLAPMLNPSHHRSTDMKRVGAIGWLLACTVGFAQTPVSVLPGTMVKTPLPMPQTKEKEKEKPKDTATPSTIIPPAGSGTTASLPALPIMVSPPVEATSLPSLSSLLTSPLPTMPTLSPYATTSPAGCVVPTQSCVPCGAPLFSTRTLAGRSCMDRLKIWLNFQPAPGCTIPVTTTSYEAPLRNYFPCSNVKNPGYPAQCATGNCTTGTCAVPGARCATSTRSSEFWDRWGLAAVRGSSCTDPACKAPIQKGYGLWQTPSRMPATTGELGYSCAPMAIPLPASCVGNPAGTIPPCQSCATRPRCPQTSLDQLAGLFHPYGGGSASACKDGSCGTNVNAAPPTATVPVIMGYYQPSKQGFRFAHPTSHSGANAPGTGPIMPPPPPTGLAPLNDVIQQTGAKR